MTQGAQGLDLASPPARQAAARSLVYSLFARVFVAPDPDLHQAFADGVLQATLAELAAELPFPAPRLEPFPQLPPLDQLHSDFIGFFEVGTKRPPCPLYEGAFIKHASRKAIWEELLRFYAFFNLKMSDQVRELPDHISAELEFMHYLSFLEAAAFEPNKTEGPDRPALVRAQRDFLKRRLAPWTNGLARGTRDRNGPATYRRLLEFLAAFTKGDLNYLEALSMEVPK